MGVQLLYVYWHHAALQPKGALAGVLGQPAGLRDCVRLSSCLSSRCSIHLTHQRDRQPLADPGHPGLGWHLLLAKDLQGQPSQDRRGPNASSDQVRGAGWQGVRGPPRLGHRQEGGVGHPLPSTSSALPSRKTPAITVEHHLHDVVSLFLPATDKETFAADILTSLTTFSFFLPSTSARGPI